MTSAQKPLPISRIESPGCTQCFFTISLSDHPPTPHDYSPLLFHYSLFPPFLIHSNNPGHTNAFPPPAVAVGAAVHFTSSPLSLTVFVIVTTLSGAPAPPSTSLGTKLAVAVTTVSVPGTTLVTTAPGTFSVARLVNVLTKSPGADDRITSFDVPTADVESPDSGTVKWRVVKCVIVAPGGRVTTVVTVLRVVVEERVTVTVWSGSWTVRVVVVVM